MDVQALGPHVRDILTAPGVDLTTISAKRVRKELLETNPSLTADDVKENKDEIDALISRIFEEVNRPHDGDEDEKSSNGKRKQEDDENLAEDEAEADSEVNGESSRPKKKAKMSKEELNDAEIARQLSNELNARGRSSRTGKASGAKKSRKSKKSAATVESDEEHSEGAPKKKRGGGGAKGGFAKEYTLSEPLAAVVDAEKLSRPQLVKQLWIYIKANELQNPSNKREIMCDAKLKAVFGADKIDMFKMNKHIGQHLHES
ncbi:SWIB-domain-containing protein [Neolentinus lepideus HHB14362 ss-1]|uniref:SWIB-domain-containing protein n=1 Tax=Neolentinus lepideus HHB14362 ss-1 TaxID=1314782 RepID=A0A165RA65_9AGAM|nr:SWIB-domain-containing protein [Neolentinus lepideus HHB14362 ss-1]